jgi:hypothetical protein
MLRNIPNMGMHGGKGDKPYKIMMARFILQEIVFQQ